MALCKRRGFIFQSSEIYGGLNGFWDYGPLGTELKRNVRNAWYNDMVTNHDEFSVLPGAPRSFSMVGIESSLIMHPQVWKCSGHYDLFHDMMVDCKECKARFRADHVSTSECPLKPSRHPGEFEKCKLTEPREFNLMFKTTIGALAGEEGTAFLRPETAQGMFVNFKNVCDSTRVKIPFGIAQVGKSFRNEITPRNFTFRSREFEQMEMEFFCHPSESRAWYQYWRDRRYNWYINLGISKEHLRLRDHTADELSHYSVGTADVEYTYPFLGPGEFGELEGIAHRGDFDLRSHMEGKLVHEGDGLVVEKDAEGNPRHRGSGKDLSYFDDQTRERFIPHVIEPAAGADRGTLAFLCEAVPGRRAARRKGRDARARRAAVSSQARADQGGRISLDQEGRHAGNGPGHLPRAKGGRHRQLFRSAGGHRTPLSPPGRDRHAVLPHGRRRNGERSTPSRFATATRSPRSDCRSRTSWRRSSGGCARMKTRKHRPPAQRWAGLRTVASALDCQFAAAHAARSPDSERLHADFRRLFALQFQHGRSLRKFRWELRLGSVLSDPVRAASPWAAAAAIR